ncbi:MAG: acetyl-CoA C-acyltransferase [Actinomycetales bacterium]|nr:acetyl-CoA C-acyltransferase [Actinomycetales bacterium]
MSAVIAGYARTPFVKFCGVFARIPAHELGAHAARAALSRAGVAPERVDQVVAGQVLLAGAGQNPARQMAVAAGIPLTTPSWIVNMVCLSGAEAIAHGARLIETGDAEVVLAVGMESMSQAPHLVPGARLGKKYGAMELLDAIEVDGLLDSFEHRLMGASTEAFNEGKDLSRERQDAFAAASHQRLVAGRDFLAGEIEPYVVKEGQEPVAHDDGVRPDTTVESLAKLRPAFASEGTITAGNSSQISDGAAAVVLVKEELAASLGATPIARVVAHGLVAGPDVSLHAQPAAAIEAAMAKLGRPVSDLAAIEINEAFAAVGVHSTDRLGVDPAIVNRHGGAIALGHPVGASGTRIVGTLARQLQALGAGSLGAAALCGGGGQGSAIVLEAV